MIIDTFNDHFETIIETLFETFYIFMWIVYVNNYFFKYNKRINDLEVEIVGLRRMVYAFLDDKTQTTHFSKHYSIVPVKKNEKNEKNDVLNERVIKLKKMILSLREELDELKRRMDYIEDEKEHDYEPSEIDE